MVYEINYFEYFLKMVMYDFFICGHILSHA